MKYKEFEKHVLVVKEALEKEVILSKELGVTYAPKYVDSLIESVCSLLKVYFNDEFDWISYWIWDLEFGEKYKDGMVKIGNENTSLKTIEDLYKVITC